MFLLNLCLERYWWGWRFQGGGGGGEKWGVPSAMLSPPEWFCINKMGSDASQFNVEWQSHKTAQTTTFEEYGELMWTWTEVCLLASLAPLITARSNPDRTYYLRVYMYICMYHFFVTVQDGACGHVCRTCLPVAFQKCCPVMFVSFCLIKVAMKSCYKLISKFWTRHVHKCNTVGFLGFLVRTV